MDGATGKQGRSLDMRDSSGYRQFSHCFTPENSKRPGIPPSHPNNHHSLPYSQIMGPRPTSQSPGPSHSRSLSQPPIISIDSLPPLNPSTYREHFVSDPNSTYVSTEERVANSYCRFFPSLVNGGVEFQVGESLPPRRGHMRSNSDSVPLTFDAMSQSSSQSIPIGSQRLLEMPVSRGLEKPKQFAKQDLEWNNYGNNNEQHIISKKYGGMVAHELINAYINLDNMDKLNLTGTDDEDLDSRASGSKINGADISDNEVESRINVNSISLHSASSSFATDKREWFNKRGVGDIEPAVGLNRSVSMDSYMASLNFDDESLKIGTPSGQTSPVNSVNVISPNLTLEFLRVDFNEAELKKIVANEKLLEIALGDPKRVKRILANRLSAARSKERKVRYISELEHQVQTSQTEATTLSTHLTMLQRDYAGLASQNNELKFRLQAMEQQTHLKNALNNALTEEVQRLKIQVLGHSGEVQLSNSMAQQVSLNPQMYQLQNQGYQQQEQVIQLQPRQENDEAAQP